MNGNRRTFRDYLGALRDLDRRWVYLFTFISLSIPILFTIQFTPPRLLQARRLCDYVEEIAERAENGGERCAVLVCLDWGPQTKAELQPITRVLLKHLMYRRVPAVVMTLFQHGAPLTEAVPHEVAQLVVRLDESGKPIETSRGLDEAGEPIAYGTHWVNIGFRPGWEDAIRALASDFRSAVPRDAERSEAIDSFPVMEGIEDADSFGLMVEITGLVGAFDMWLQFFKKDKTMPFGLGCTSISIPESYVYIDSGRLRGFFEGIAGAAAYERILYERYGLEPHQKAYGAMTAQIFGQGLIVFLVVLGNAAWLASRQRERKRA